MTEEDIFECQRTEIIFGFHRQMACHQRMERCEAFFLQYIVQCSDITKTNQPFGMFTEAGKIELS